MAKNAKAAVASKGSVEYSVRFVPERIRMALRGKRPPIMEIGNILLQVEDKNILRTFIFFGGVPTPKLHEALSGTGFRIRRVQLEYYSKKTKTTYRLADTDNGCWAAYYNTNPELSDEQIELISKLFKVVAKAGRENKTFLCPTWKAVDDMWGNREEWLNVVRAPEVEKKEEEEEEAPVVMLDDDGIL